LKRTRRRRALRRAALVAGAGLAWGLYEAQWLERRELEVVVRGLPPALEGFRLLHLSDFHLGSLSLNARPFRSAIEWASGLDVDLVAITGDLLSRDRGERELRDGLRRLKARHGVVAVLGNHDVAVTRDPFSAARELADLEDAGAILLRDSSHALASGGARIQVVGVGPRSYMRREARPQRLVDRAAELRILLCHFPRVVDGLEPGAFHLVLAGHVHGGQICLPYPGGKVTFGELRPGYREGVYLLPQTTLVVSRGTGTAFVPLRVFARPEAALLVLRRGV
jgi:predicted MPP superfamily phosphohydrolase